MSHSPDIGALPEFPDGFFGRADESPDPLFYGPTRLVQHLDDAAIAAVGTLYMELSLTGDVLDLCSSWVSHFHEAPQRLTVLGMNETELARNPQATERVIHDLNTDPDPPLCRRRRSTRRRAAYPSTI